MRKPITFLAMSVLLGLVCLGVYRQVTLEKALAQNDLPFQYRYSAYWTTAYGFESTIELHNNLINEPLSVTPVLYTANGAAIELDEAQMGVLGSASVKINEALAAKGVSQPQSGSAVFRYSRKFGGALSAEISVIHYQKTLAYTIPSIESVISPSNVHHAAFWLPSKRAEVYVALQNISDQTIHVTPSVQIDGNDFQLAPVTLGPNQSAELEYPEGLDLKNPKQALGWFKNNVGGVSLTHDGPAGALNTSGWIEDEQTGYSTMMSFSGPATAHGHHLFGTQILLGEQTISGLDKNASIETHLVLRNTTDQEVATTGEFAYETDGDIVKLPLSLGKLGAYEVRDIDVSDLQRRGSIPRSVSTGSVEIEHLGVEGALMGRVYSAFGRTYGFYSALEDHAAGSYSGVYWSTEGDWNSVLTVANFGEEPDKVTVEIAYNGGTFILPEISLSPLQSTTVDFRRLILDSTKDRDGNSFPKDVHHGGYRIYGDPLKSQLVVKEQVLSGRLGIAAPFYQSCDYVVDYYLSPGSIVLNLVGGSTVVTSYCVFSSAGVQSDSGSSFSWGSNVAVSGSGASRTVQAVSAGSGVLGGTSSSVPIDMTCFMMYRYQNINVTVQCPVPTNFHQTAVSDVGGGTLHFEYAWGSSTGNLADLSQCTVGEKVDYNSADLPFPSPPFPAGINPQNPTIVNLAATTGTFADNHSTPDSFVKPYSATGLTSLQIYRYTCACASGGQPVTIAGTFNIVRQVSQNAGGSWKFTITKNGSSATINPLP